MLESVWQEHKRSPHGWSALHNHLQRPLRLIGHHGYKGLLHPSWACLLADEVWFVTMGAKEAGG